MSNGQQSDTERLNKPVSITRIAVPLPMTLAVIGIVFMMAASMVGVWVKMAAHADQGAVHVDAVSATVGGGVAYKSDVRTVEYVVERRAIDEHKKTRKLIRAMKIFCRRQAADFVCAVELPESE